MLGYLEEKYCGQGKEMKLRGVILSVSCLFFSVVATLAADTSPAKQSPRTFSVIPSELIFKMQVCVYANNFPQLVLEHWRLHRDGRKADSSIPSAIRISNYR